MATGSQPARQALLPAAAGRYALAYPLHASQRVLVHDAAEIYLPLAGFDTHGLRRELLSYGPAVEVLAPAGLQAWVQQQRGAARRVS